MAFAWNARREAFCREYLIDLNAAQAAMRAGYSAVRANRAGYDMLQHPEIAARIQALMTDRAARTDLTSDYVLDGIRECAERCMQRAPVLVRRGKEMVQATDDDGRQVWQFDASGALRAFELMGKHLKLFTDRVEHDVTDGLADQLALARARAKNR